MDEARELAAVLGDSASEHGATGAVVGVLDGDESHVAACGVTNVEYPRPLGGHSLFQVGSISKTFTSAAIGLLVDDGLMRFEDPVSRHLPGLAAYPELESDALTVEHTLSHQGGFDGDHLLVSGRGRGLEALAGVRRLFPTGEGFSYSNAAFSIAGAVVEAVAGTDYPTFVRDRLLRPLGMSSATFRADEAITYDVAAPHWVLGGESHVLRGVGWQPGWQLAAVDWPAGGLVASIEHLVSWCRFQRSGATPDGDTLLSRETLERLHAPVVTADLLDRVALDWFVREIDGVRTIGHGGLTVGYVSDLIIAPERNFAFVAASNATNGGSVIRTVRRWALEHFAGIKESDPVTDPDLDVDVSRVVGAYLHPFAVLNVAVSDAPGRITITPSVREVDGWQPPLDPAVEAGFFAPGHVVTADAPGPARVGRFGPDVDGPAEWLLWGHRRAPGSDRPGEPDGLPAHSPVKTGGRFSRKACIPSTRSLVPEQALTASRSSASASSSGACSAPTTQRSTPATETGGFAASSRASACAAARRSAIGCSSCTRPISWARRPSIFLARRIMSRAWSRPTHRVSLAVPPHAGTVPRSSSGSPILAPSAAASRKWQESATSSPPPRQ